MALGRTAHILFMGRPICDLNAVRCKRYGLTLPVCEYPTERAAREAMAKYQDRVVEFTGRVDLRAAFEVASGGCPLYMEMASRRGNSG